MLPKARNLVPVWPKVSACANEILFRDSQVVWMHIFRCQLRISWPNVNILRIWFTN